MMRLLGRFIDLAEAGAWRPASTPERIVAHGLRCAPLQRMGEEIGDDELRAFAAARSARWSASSHALVPAPETPDEARDAAHG